MSRVFVTRQLPGPALTQLGSVHETEVWPQRRPPTGDELRAHARGAQALLCTVDDRLDASMLAELPDLRVIANYAVGHDNIDVSAARARGIAVTNTPDVLTAATADLTWALLLAVARHIVPAAAGARQDWVSWEPAGFLGAEIAGATLGIIGAGRIGQAVARRAIGFDMTVISAGRDRGGLLDLLARSDFISLHCPLIPATRHLINADTLACTRRGAILINTARGAIVDAGALVDAVREGQLAGAALDVTDPEPLPSEHPLLHTPNILVTPHIGSATLAARSRMAQIAVDNILAALAGEPLCNPVG